jgi:diguanylate cyclase (GGDEF)-like protein/PAS domain S-box-containing protein
MTRKEITKMARKGDKRDNQKTGKPAQGFDERRTSEKDRREGEQKIRIILKGSPIPAFVIGTDHRVIFWNRALEELSGIKAEDVMGTDRYWMAFYKEERPCMADLLVDNRLDELHDWYRGNYTKSKLIDDAYEATDFFPDLGTNGKWLRFTAAALKDPEGNLVGVIETLEDETERKLAQDALRESEQKLKSTLEGSSIPSFVIGEDHRILYWNRALEELSGIKAADVTGTKKQWTAFYKKERPCMADLLVNNSLKDLTTWYGDKIAKSKLIEDAYEATDFFPDLGSKGKWLRFTATILKDSKGKLVGAIETLEDVTDRKLAEEALRESEQRLKAILEGSPIPTFVIDTDHRIIHWNRALEEMSGIIAEEVIETDQHWRAFYDERRPCMADLLVDRHLDEIPLWYEGKYTKSKLIEDAYEATDFFPYLGNNGKWLRFTAAALKDSHGFFIGAVETLEDITDRKLAEEALRNSEMRYRRLSITDALTKLYNSRRFYNQLRSEIDRANRYSHPLSLLLLDIDNFKDYNDTYGHLEGDTVLIRLGEVIRRCLRKTDSAYRFGGEEFTAILPETHGDDATTLAERIRAEFENEVFRPNRSEKPHKTVSVGIAEYKSGEDLKTLLKRVDANMYVSKRAGKNRTHFE